MLEHIFDKLSDWTLGQVAECSSLKFEDMRVKCRQVGFEFLLKPDSIFLAERRDPRPRTVDVFDNIESANKTRNIV